MRVPSVLAAVCVAFHAFAPAIALADGKAVVFTKFPEAVPLVGSFLEKMGIGALSLREGGKRWWKPQWRRSADATPPVEVFRRDKACRVLVLEANASAAGLTLTCAQHVVFLDVLCSDLLESQARARVARIGQTKPTTAWHLIAKGSTEELLRDAADDGMLPTVLGDDSSGKLDALLRRAEENARSINQLLA